MKVRLLVSRVTNDGAENRGDVIDVSAEEGAALIKAEQAELLRQAEPERAIKRGPKPERA